MTITKELTIKTWGFSRRDDNAVTLAIEELSKDIYRELARTNPEIDLATIAIAAHVEVLTAPTNTINPDNSVTYHFGSTKITVTANVY